MLAGDAARPVGQLAAANPAGSRRRGGLTVAGCAERREPRGLPPCRVAVTSCMHPGPTRPSGVHAKRSQVCRAPFRKRPNTCARLGASGLPMQCQVLMRRAGAPPLHSAQSKALAAAVGAPGSGGPFWVPPAAAGPSRSKRAETGSSQAPAPAAPRGLGRAPRRNIPRYLPPAATLRGFPDAPSALPAACPPSTSTYRPCPSPGRG